MVVRELVPGQGWRLVGLALLMLAVVSTVAWFAGRRHLLESLALVDDGAAVDAGALLERLATENRSMRDELAVYRNGGDLSREVEERVRAENRVLQDRVAELEQAVVSYRRAAYPDPGGKGLRIDRVELSRSDSASKWLLHVILVRTGGTDSTIEGQLNGSLVTEGASGRHVLPVAQFLSEGQAAFRVRYVTEVKAELDLPSGQSPVRLDLVAELSVPRQDRIEKSWQRSAAKVQGGVRNAGQD